MRRATRFLPIVPAALVAALAPWLMSRGYPLGVRGEWEWLRLPHGPAGIDVALAATAVLAYAAAAALGFRFLSTGRGGVAREATALAGLLPAAVLIQAILPTGAPREYGLARWPIVTYLPASTGYYTIARHQIGDPGSFLRDYPEWIRRQDSLHVGTHPPGLFLVEHALIRTLAARPKLARAVNDHLPESIRAGFAAIAEPLPPADRAALGLSGVLTMLACAATVVPLYVLARASLPPPAAWAAAVVWPLVPAAILFQPVPDIAYPLLSTTAFALAAHAGRASLPWGLALAAASGVVLAVGMAFTLAFLAAGLVVGLVLATAPGTSVRRGLALVAATGAGFLVPTLASWQMTGASPFAIWWWNQQNHARFYREYHRTYRLWVLINPVELAMALGIPAAFWAVVGLAHVRSAPRVAWATLALLTLLTLSGRSLSEVARLWLPFLPPLLAAAGHGLARLGAGPATLAATVATLGAETLLLEGTIQVVYPI
jgi:hypothetical protein